MNKTYTNQKLMFLAIASTAVILQTSNRYMDKIQADEDENSVLLTESSIARPLIFDGENQPFVNSERYESLIKIAEDYQQQKKLEEEERLRLENLKTYIYIDSNDLRVLSDIKVEELSMLLKDTDLQPLAQDYIDAQDMYQVNALFLAALTANESGWGTSWLAQNKNNLSGYAAYPGQEENARYFNSKRESIMETAKLISEHYLNPEGKYHNGFALEDVNVMYCQFKDGSANYSWSSQIKTIMSKFAEELKPITEELKEDVEAVSYVYFNGVMQ